MQRLGVRRAGDDYERVQVNTRLQTSGLLSLRAAFSHCWLCVCARSSHHEIEPNVLLTTYDRTCNGGGYPPGPYGKRDMIFSLRVRIARVKLDDGDGNSAPARAVNWHTANKFNWYNNRCAGCVNPTTVDWVRQHRKAISGLFVCCGHWSILDNGTTQERSCSRLSFSNRC